MEEDDNPFRPTVTLENNPELTTTDFNPKTVRGVDLKFTDFEDTGTWVMTRPGADFRNFMITYNPITVSTVVFTTEQHQVKRSKYTFKAKFCQRKKTG